MFIHDIHHAADVAGVEKLAEVKARWLGHRLIADLGVEVNGSLSVAEASDIARSLDRELREHLPALSASNIRWVSTQSAKMQNRA